MWRGRAPRSVRGGVAWSTSAKRIPGGWADPPYGRASPCSRRSPWVHPAPLARRAVTPASRPVTPRRHQTYTLRAGSISGSTQATVTVVAQGLELLAGNLSGPGWTGSDELP
jgi:hypothetical protein